MPSANVFNTTINIQRNPPTKGTSGGNVFSPVNVYTNVPARVDNASATWQQFYAKKHIMISHQIYVGKQGLTIKPGDLVIWQGRTLYVAGERLLGGKKQTLRIDCTEDNIGVTG